MQNSHLSQVALLQEFILRNSYVPLKLELGTCKSQHSIAITLLQKSSDWWCFSNTRTQGCKHLPQRLLWVPGTV